MRISLIMFAAAIALAAAVPCVAAPADEADQRIARQMRDRAEAGDRWSQVDYGSALLTGRFGMTVDTAQGLVWITKAADGGDTRAQLLLGQIYERSKYVAPDGVAAMSWYRKASAGGSAQASIAVATHYDHGVLVSRDHAEAIKWYEVAAGQGNDSAALELGRRYDTGTDGAPLDHDKAMAAYGKVAIDRAAEVDRAICANNTTPASTADNWARVLSYCQKLEAKDDLTGVYAMGVAYTFGKGVPADTARGLGEIRTAADRGYGEALNTLGDLYLAGTLVPRDEAAALDWHRKAMQKGAQSGMLAAAQQYERGQGTAVDLGRAARLYGLMGRIGKGGLPETADAWFKAHPQFPAEAERAKVVSFSSIPRNLIFYDIPPKEIRSPTGQVTREARPPADLQAYWAEEIGNYYPPRAQDDEVEGSAGAECIFTADGTFADCVRIFESPAGYGFGNALDKAIEKLGQSRNKADWAPVYVGKSLSITVAFQLG
jgi:hypothetical protein